MTTPDPRTHLLSLLKEFDTGILTSVAPDGSLHARPLRVASTEPEGTLWFPTTISSPKVDEIQADRTVSVTFQSRAIYLAFSGTASVVRDRAKIDEVWSEPMKVWFPEGKDDPELVLLRVALDTGEYWDQRGASGLKYMFKAAKAYMTGNRPEADGPDEHGVVEGVAQRGNRG
jgi:general stress protein 26